MLLQSVAVRVRELRKARGLTQTAVIEDTGISMGRIESCNVNLTLTSVAILCKYFEISLSEFFDGINLSD